MKCVKLIIVTLLSALYYVTFCYIMGFDLGDPWKKLMEWAKK